MGLLSAAGVMERMAAVQRAAGMARYLGITLNNLMSMLRPMGKMSEILSHADEAEDALRRGGASPEVSNVVALRAWAEAHLGRPSEAFQHLAEACQASQWTVRADVLVEAAELHIALGDDDEAQRYLEEAAAFCVRLAPSWAMWRTARLWLLLRRGDVEGAAQQAGEISDQVTYNPGQRVATAALLGHLAWLRGDPDARAVLRQTSAAARLQSAGYWARYCELLLAALDGSEALSRSIAGLGIEERALVSVLAEPIVEKLPMLDEAAAAVVEDQAETHPLRWRPVLRRAIAAEDPALRLAAGRLLDRIGATADVPRLRSLSRTLKGVHADPQLGRGLAKRLAAPVFVEDLGSLEIRVDERSVRGSQVRRKPIALLCFLLSRPEWRVTRDQVVDALWPDNEPEDAVNSLNQTLYFLRRLIDPSYQEDISPAYVCNSGEVVWLDGDLIESRSRRVRKLVQELTRDLDLTRVEDLLSEYRGPFALDFAYEEWAHAYRDSLHASFLGIVERAIEATIVKRDHGLGIRIARRALEIDPEADQIELGLVRLYRLSGATAAAAEQYAHYAATVRRELGVEPPPLESL